jgi:hypothetical protein
VAVPKFAVHEHGDAAFWKHKIRISKQMVSASPPCNFVRSKDADHFQLSQLVSATLDFGHDLRSLLLRKAVHKIVFASAILCIKILF